MVGNYARTVGDSIFINELGKGIYAVPDAARFTKVTPRRIRYWIEGKDSESRASVRSPGLWAGQHESIDNKNVLGFLDLQEVRFVDAFLKKGVSWQIQPLRERSSSPFLVILTLCAISKRSPVCFGRFGDGRCMSKKRANVERVELMGQGRSTRLSALSQKQQNEASRHATSDARERIPTAPFGHQHIHSRPQPGTATEKNRFL
jgi:hypothetical protein